MKRLLGRTLLLTLAGIRPGLLAADDAPPAAPPAPRAEAKSAAHPAPFTHRGLTVDVAALAKLAHREPSLASLRRQIDMVVDAPVKPKVAEFFRTIRVSLGAVPPGAGPGISRGRSVNIIAEPIAPNRVVLLHELLHSYHALEMTPEARRQVTRFFEQARQGRYPFAPSEYFLTNEREFFAVTASVYLHGTIPRPPGTRQAIQQAQPEYVRFLSELFDPAPAPAPPPTPAAPSR